MRIDLHMHTTRYSPCAKASAEEMMEAAVRRGLDGVVITEHGVMWNDDEIHDLRKAFPALRIFRGIELTTEEGEDIVIIGMPDAESLGERPPCADVVRPAREAGAATILAHPLRYRAHIADSLYATPPDACEGWSINIFGFQRPGIFAFSRAIGCGVTAASDAHAAFGVGIYAVDIEGVVADERELAVAIREKRYTAFRNDAIRADIERDLTQRVRMVKEDLAAGEDHKTIHERMRCSFSFINHVAAGRYPSMADEDLG